MSNNQTDTVESTILKLISGTLKEVGIPGFLVLFVVTTFLFYATAEQKKEFIDQYILFKSVDTQPIPFYFVALILLVTIIGQNYYYRKRLFSLQKEIERIGKEKSELQSILLEKVLRSSQ